MDCHTEQKVNDFPTLEEYLAAVNTFSRMGIPVPLTIPETKRNLEEARKLSTHITMQDVETSWKMVHVIVPQHIIHPHRTKEVVFAYKPIENRYCDMLRRKVIKRITQVMSATKEIAEFQRTQTIDCDIMDFF